MVTIEYTYVDASNWKQHAKAYFRGMLSDEQIEAMRAVLQDNSEESFIPSQIGMEDLQLRWNGRLYDDDGVWHRLDELVCTDEECDKAYPLAADLYTAVMRVRETGWDVDSAMQRLGIAV